MEKSILFAAIAGAILVGAVFAAIQTVPRASTVHSGISELICNVIDGAFDQGAVDAVNQTNDSFSSATNSCTIA